MGTLAFAILTIADRYSPSKVFFISALIGAAFNVSIILQNNTLVSLLVFRFCTGFFLAGIYPVGMKIAADHFEKGLGKSLGFLVGALVLGTAFPHLLKDVTSNYSWKWIIVITSIFAVLGGVLMILLVPDGPFRRPLLKQNLSAFFGVFKVTKFKSFAFGYFGHMWELYAFWAFVPIMLNTYQTLHPEVTYNISLLSFLIIAIGGFACITVGYLAKIIDIKKMATYALLTSGICCLVSPLFFYQNSTFVFIAFMLFWGMAVIADSPLFSTLIAQNAPPENKGSALTIVNCIGYSITISSIILISFLSDWINPSLLYVALAIGPIFGLISLNNLKKQTI